jgi:hypothetical protein
MTKIKNKLPSWFDGLIYDKGDVVVNPFTNAEYELTNIELSMYDFIMGTQMVMELAPKTVTKTQITNFHKGLSWFRSNNSEAYMVLLD